MVLSEQPPRPSVLDYDELVELKDLRMLQGRELSAEEGEKLEQLQRKFIRDSLEKGLFALTEVVERSGDSDSGFIDLIYGIKGISGFLIREEEGKTLLDIYRDLMTILMRAHEPVGGDGALSDQEKLFLEFLVGLCCTEINGRVALATVQKMLELDEKGLMEPYAEWIKKLDPHSWVVLLERFRDISQLAYQLGDFLQEIFGTDPEYFWLLYTKALKSDPELERTAKAILSMRYLPPRKGLDMVAMAQALHFRGFAGDGSIFDGIPSLEPLKRQAINWHGEKDAKAPHFSKRMGLFAAAINPLKDREARTVDALVDELFPQQQSIRILDLGSGPTAKGSHRIAASLNRRGKNVSITASDYDGGSLKSLARLNGKSPDERVMPLTTIERALFLDLNRPWGNFPEEDFDITVPSICLHQIADEENPIGLENLAQVFHEMTRVTRIGGLISWAEVGALEYIQSPIIPFNATDREGRVLKNLFSMVSYESVAVPTRVEGTTQYYKIPYRLSALRYATPEDVVETYDAGIYEYNAFIILEVPEDIVKKLDQHRSNPSPCNAIINAYLKAKERVGLLQRRVRNRVQETVEQ